jgi:5-methylcytosine-specific restriction endonuclease McrA
MAISAEDQLQFLANIQKLLSDGAVNTTYKFALLLAIADLAVERGDDTSGELFIHLDDVSEKVISFYWPHVVPYPAVVSASHRSSKASDLILVQRSQRDKSPKIVTEVIKARQHSGHSLAKLLQAEELRTNLIRMVRSEIVKNPLWRLQVVNRSVFDFLYPQEEITAGGITLRPGVAFCLRRFYPLIYDLIRSKWVSAVREWNQNLLGDATELEGFLFGQRRSSLQDVATVLEDLQAGKCFYCGHGIKREDQAVDHFIPWARYPLDDMFNFVLTDAKCNLAKKDHLAAAPHRSRWVERNVKIEVPLQEAGMATGFSANSAVVNNITQWAYENARVIGEPVWVSGSKFDTIGI